MSVRTILLASGISAAAVLVLGPFLIPLLRHLRVGQRVRDDGPRAHLAKQGTPTMGGILFIAAATLGSVVAMALGPERYSPDPFPQLRLVLVLVTMLGYGALGFLDDFRKVVLRRPLGLRAREKLAGQLLIALVLFYVSVHHLGQSTVISLPTGSFNYELGPAYVLLVVVILLGTSNAVNLTDGLDGLAAGLAVFAYGAYAVIGYWLELTELAIFAAAMAGGCLAFLAFNYHPARIFMGDTGSLALGGGLGALAILSKTELLLPVLGGVFVVETLSVMLQVLYFRRTGGKRIFRMSPLHHHFELGGWHEVQVVHRFWLFGFFLAILAVILLVGG